MCGIAGIISLSSDNPPVNQEVLSRMLGSIETRGPDARGIWMDPQGQIALANVRLSTSDSSALANQPMMDAEGVVVGTFNGEIYNYKELRRELEAKGYSFKTRSDTEVLLNCYKVYGAQMLPKLEGQFAFVLFNRKTKEILMARDPMGISPFYYTVFDNYLYFASEPRAILEIPGLPRQINRQSLYQHFVINSTCAGETLFQGMRYLRAGNYISTKLFEPWREKRYADYLFRKSDSPSLKSEEDWARHFRSLLHDAVARRMVADKKVGIFLSGGLDSTVILGLMREVAPDQELSAFSVGFEEISTGEIVGELPEAHQSSALFHAKQEDVVIRAEDLIRGVDRFEIPPTSILDVVLDILSKTAVDHGIDVALTGEGSDETFFGYDHYWAVIGQLEPQYRGLSELFPLRQKKQEGDSKLTDFFLQGGSDASVEHDRGTIFQCGLSDIVPAKAAIESLLEELQAIHPSPELDKQIMYADLCQKMPESFIRRMERPTMGNGLEVRLPFLDLRLILSHFQLPMSVRLKTTELKGLLCKAVSDLLPPDMLYRPKIPFGMPIARSQYYRGSGKTFSKPAFALFFHKYQDQIREAVFCGGLISEGILREDYLQERFVKQKNPETAEFDPFLWKVWTFSIWYDKWMKGDTRRIAKAV